MPFIRLILALAQYIPGIDSQSVTLRTTLARQCNLIIVLLLRSLSISVHRRLPTLNEVVDAGH